MREYGTDVLRLAFSYVKNWTQAEDIAQLTFIKCYDHLHQFKGRNMKSWLLKITSNSCKDYLRSWHYRHTVISDKIKDVLKVDSPEQILLEKDDNEQLAQVVLHLPLKYREIIYLHYFEGISLIDISDMLELNINTVKSRHKRAKELFKKKYLERMD